MGTFIACSAHALTLDISYPEGIPQGKVTTSYNITTKNDAGAFSNVGGSTTYKDVYTGLNYFAQNLQRYKPVQDNNVNHNFIGISLEGKSNNCVIKQLHNYQLIRLQLFKDGHCVNY